MRYFPLVEPLLLPKYMPVRQRTISITLTNEQEVTSVHYKVTEHHVIISTSAGIETYSMNAVKGITYQEELKYPILPSGITTPSKSDSLKWAISTIRAVLAECNEKSRTLYTNPITVCVDFDQITKTLILNMTGFWSTLPAFVRHRWLQDFWALYAKLIVMYGASPDYHRVELRPFDEADKVIGRRSPWQSWILDGPECRYNLLNGGEWYAARI